MRRFLAGLLAVALVAVGIFTFSCGDGDHGGLAILLGTYGQRSANEPVAVLVRDAYTGQAIGGAIVWLNNDTANAQATDSTGWTTFANVPAGTFTITAGATGTATTPAYALQTFGNVNSKTIYFALEPLPDNTGDYVQVSGRVTGADTGLAIDVYGVADIYGIESQSAFQGSGSTTFDYTFYVLRGYPFIVAATQWAGTPNPRITRLNYAAVSGLTGNLANVNLPLQLLSEVTSTGTITNATNFADYAVGTALVLGHVNFLTLAVNGGSLSTGSATYTLTYPSIANAVFATTGTGDRYAGQLGRFSPSAAGPHVDMTQLDRALNVSWPSNGGGDLTPAVSWSNSPFGISGNTGFYTVHMEHEDTGAAGRPLYRAWTIFLPETASSVTFPEVPGALAGQGFVAGQGHEMYVMGQLQYKFDFNNGIFHDYLFVPAGGAEFGEEDHTYTP
jgi:hypothetical protein